MTKMIKQTLALLLVVGMVTSTTAHDHKSTASAANIVETAASTGQFETLLAAAKAAGLVSALTGDGPLTVFAPTDEAFGALPAGTINELLKPENKDVLARILTFHVVSGQIGSDALANKVALKTLAGPKVTFTQSEQGFTVEGARIINTDINASNGVVHVIDRVIMPPQQMSRVDAQNMIMRAIAKGVPMFNHGNSQATARIYAQTAETLLSSAELAVLEKELLKTGIKKASSANNSQEQAWELRYALDDVMRSMEASN